MAVGQQVWLGRAATASDATTQGGRQPGCLAVVVVVVVVVMHPVRCGVQVQA